MIAEAPGLLFPILPLVKQSATTQSGEMACNYYKESNAPRDFDYSPYFQIIKYPFVNYSYHADYRLLPWHGQVLEGKEAEMYMSAQQIQALKDQHKSDMQDNMGQVAEVKTADAEGSSGGK